MAIEGMQRTVIVDEFKRILNERSERLAALKATEATGDVEANHAANRAYAETLRFSEGFERAIIMALSEQDRNDLRAEAVRQLRAERTA